MLSASREQRSHAQRTKAAKGQGSEDSRREERDERTDNGQYAKLKGLKGSGPSLTQVQAADDGDGTSRRKATETQRDFQRQFESFVDREDVPEDLKNGVKEYFTTIHNVETSSAKTDAAAEVPAN